MYDGNAALKIEADCTVIESLYHPHPKQKTLHCSPANEIMYGGAAGPGKSRAIREEGKDWCLRVPGLQVYLFRRTFPELERNHIIPMRAEIPMEVAKWNEKKNRFEFANGAMLHMCHAQHEHDVFQYQGAEIHLLLIDELTTFTEFMYDYLRGRVRCPLEISERYRNKIPGIIAGSNPGGIGHEFVNRRWVLFAKPYECKRASDEEGGMLRQYIPGLLEDNPTLLKNDPKYEFRLLALPEPYRSAYRWGRWDIWLGQAFDFYKQLHVIDPIPIPDYAQIYMTFDWGYGAPFSLGWWWVDLDNRIYRFSEWYGWNGTPNTGLRMVDEEIAKGIKEREKEMSITKDQRARIIRLAGPDCWNKKPDYMGGGQGPSTFEVFSNFGVFLTPGDADRKLKIRQFRSRLNVPPHVKEALGAILGSTRALPDSLKVHPNDRPMMMIYRNCEQFIRTVPLMQVDDSNVEDVDGDGEAHCLHGDTLVCTKGGDVPIRNLIGTVGEVLTAGGEWTPYNNCRRTRRFTEVVEILFEDGRKLICTKDHKLLKNTGEWIEAKDLTNALGCLFGKSVKPIKVNYYGKTDVFCLDVEHPSHAFAVCGGILVHNCYDDSCHICMARPLTVKALDKAREQQQALDALVKGKVMDKRLAEFFLLDRGPEIDSGYNPLDKQAGY